MKFYSYIHAILRKNLYSFNNFVQVRIHVIVSESIRAILLFALPRTWHIECNIPVDPALPLYMFACVYTPSLYLQLPLVCQ